MLLARITDALTSPKARRFLGVFIAITSLSLAACESRIGVSASANAPVQYSHVFVTVEQVWVNPSATAPPEDASWVKFPLSSPQTLDLVSLSDGTVTEFARELPLSPGNYAQMLLVLSDTSAPLASSAQAAGATFNNEVIYFDASGTEQQAPLTVPNAAAGVSVPIDLHVPTAANSLLGAFTSPGSTSGTTPSGTVSPTTGLPTTFNPTTGMPITGAPTTGTPAGTSFGTGTSSSTGAGGSQGGSSSGTSGTNTGSGSSTGSGTGSNTGGSPTTGDNPTTGGSDSTADTSDTGTTTANAAVLFDATRDVVPVTFSAEQGFVLSAQPSGIDLDEVGTIAGRFALDAIVPDPASGRPDIQVTAQTLSEDGSRHVPVLSAPVRPDGTFVLYPFRFTRDAPSEYDLVIHGPQIQTVIIKSVPVTQGAPSAAAIVPFGNIALLPAQAYAVNVAAAASAQNAGAHIGFYQTLAGRGEVPYLIEERTIDPLTGRFASDQLLPAADVISGTFVPGQLPSFTAAPPAEGSGSYRIAVSAPVYGSSEFGNELSPPATGNTTVTFSMPELAVPTPAAAGTISATVSVTSPKKYDQGALVLSQGAAVVASVSLNSILESAQDTGTVSLTRIPAGTAVQPFDAGLYRAETWAWHSRDPAGTFTRKPLDAAVDLRGIEAASISLTID